MAKPQYGVSELIASIKRRCMVPTSQITFTNQDWVLMANDELQGVVVPQIMTAREEYFLDWVDVYPDASGIVEIPEEAVGAKLRTVAYRQQETPLLLVNLPRLNLDTVAGVGANFVNGLTFTGFYVQDNSICLYPNTSIPTGIALRVYYFRRSLMLASPENVGIIRSIDPGSNTITLSRTGRSWEVGTKLNAVSSSPNFKVTNVSFEINTLSSPSIVVDSVEGLQVGDYITEEGYSGIPQIPVEAHAYLAQLTAAKALEALGDDKGMKSALAKAESLKTNLFTMISSRVDGSPKKVINPNGGVRISSSLRGIRRGSWGF